jgi:hypothetical protein
VRDIVATVLANRERIFERINEPDLERYSFLQSSLRKVDVSSDRHYRRTFNSFYVVRSRKAEWYDFFYAYLERHKNNSQIKFENVLGDFHAALGRVEPSFVSKLVATIRPDAPVYDAFVRQNLGLKTPPQYKSQEIRLQGFIDVYSKMECIYDEALRGENTTVLVSEFDGRSPAYAHFTRLKKLDLMLWQLR